MHEVLEVLASAVLTRVQGRGFRRASTDAVPTLPLMNGRTLGVAYLEWLVSTGSASPNMHDEYALLLIEGIPIDSAGVKLDHSENCLEPRAEDSEAVQLCKIYRCPSDTDSPFSSITNKQLALPFYLFIYSSIYLSTYLPVLTFLSQDEVAAFSGDLF